MVLVKATFQKTVRRFTIPDDFSYEDTRKKLVEVFPELDGTAPESVLLYYRDSDNDLVIISSDEEFHTAQQHLVDKENTLKLLIAVKPPETKMETAQQENEEESMEVEDLVDGLFRPLFHQPMSIFGHNPFGSLIDMTPSWNDRRRLLQQHEDRVRRQREYEDKLRKAHQEHIKEMRERMKKEQEKKRQEVAEKKSVTGDGVTVKRDDQSAGPVIPNFPPGWVVNPYGSWEPVVYHHPSGGTTHVWGPWGYTATYGDKNTQADTDNNQQEQQPKEQKEKSEEEQAATA